jgi:KipI family sensor histidine kinase inhibitor
VSSSPRFLSVGTDALLVELGSRSRAAAAYQVVRSLLAGGDAPTSVRDVVPAARTVLLDGVGDIDAWKRVLTAAALDEADAAADVRAGEDMRVLPVAYDGEDLDVVAAAWGCSADEVVARHSEAVFTVAFCGFAPGFAYCTSEPALPTVPRRDDPRPRVPSGSVALAAEYCGVYPRAMPGGWQLIGRTDAVMFDPSREPPGLLSPGDRLRFEAT